MDRDRELDRVRQRTKPWDIIVIGGGATGVGCAVDAATRGYEVLLLEQHDFGKGTSSRSTKLVHGGVRYLEQGNVSLVREALSERQILLRNAPHVVHRLPFIVPCYSRWQKFYYGVGLKVYDLLAGRNSFGRSELLSREKTLARLPRLRPDGLTGGVLYFDGQFDDTRLLTDLVTTANKHGAAMINYSRVSSLSKDAAGNVTGVEFSNSISGESFSTRASVVVNATGAFCDKVRTMADEKAEPIVTHSQGIHLVFDRKFLASDDAVMIPRTPDGRVLFCIPWLGSTLVGTTDTPVKTAELEPQAQESEIEFVLETVGRYLDPRPEKQDIRSVFVGIRPLVRKGHLKNTSALSRGHSVEVTAGMVTITGGKWTTYRRMAEDAVDQAARIAHLKVSPSVTAGLAIEPPTPVGEDSQLHGRLPYTRMHVLMAVKDEMAQSVEDVLARRTRALFLDAAAAVEIAEQVAVIMAKELKKDNTWIQAQIAEFNATAEPYLRR